MKNDGGPAFPVIIDHTNYSQPYEQKVLVVHDGVSVRDYFAAKAMQGDWASQGISTGEFTNDMTIEQLEDHAERYYRMADAMLEAREK